MKWPLFSTGLPRSRAASAQRTHFPLLRITPVLRTLQGALLPFAFLLAWLLHDVVLACFSRAVKLFLLYDLFQDKERKKVKSLSCVRLFATPWTVSHQAPPSVGFSRQEYWGGLPFPSPGDLPDPGTKPTSPAFACRFFTTEPPGKYIHV